MGERQEERLRVKYFSGLFMPRIEPFEQYSDAYDQWFEENADKYEAELEAIRRLLPPPWAQGLEVGVGSGKFAAPLGIGLGVEPSREMALRAGRNGVSVISGVAENLPFPDEVFDFLLMVTTICFVDDIDKSFQEAYRVLKVGGSIIVGFVDRESGLGRRYEANRGESRFYRDATFFSATEVLERLKSTGFEVEQIVQTLMPDKSPRDVMDGYGKGAFIAIKSVKADEH
jgi:SAM-dependent methyltransferase